jgi:hypothetical protein
MFQPTRALCEEMGKMFTKTGLAKFPALKERLRDYGLLKNNGETLFPVKVNALTIYQVL